MMLALLALPQAAEAAPKDTDHRPGQLSAQADPTRKPQDFDTRDLTGNARVKADRAITTSSAADNAFVKGLGTQGVSHVDPLTRTVRQLARLDGFLSGPKDGAARDVALDFVRSHLGVLGLTEADLDTLVFRQDYVDNIGVHNLSWTQQAAGTPVFSNGLQVKVTKDGRVLSVGGSPISGLSTKTKKAATGDLTAADARKKAAGNVHGKAAEAKVEKTSGGKDARTTWDNHDYAKKVWFLTPDGLRLGWSTYTRTSGDEAYQHVVDATTGKALYRRSTVADHAGPATRPAAKKRDNLGKAYVYDNYPGAERGGDPKLVDMIAEGWLTKKDTALDGDSVMTWADVNDDNEVSQGETTPVPGSDGKPGFELVPFDSSDLCSAEYVCTWDETKANSWETNKAADATNAFYLASNFHDYLKNDKAIRFTAGAGNFEAKGGDAVRQNVLDGADTADGLPADGVTNNANMSTPPDGTPPTMQMYLWQAEAGFLPASGSFDASVLYHEYTHGLSNRLVIDAEGNSTLNSLQGGSMGEAWSDYYAMDYLVTHGHEKDTEADGEVLEGKYLMGGQKDKDGNLVPFRSMAIDCPVGSTSDSCVNTYNPGGTPAGGYTYGDLVAIGGDAEVHSSGEVWAQTLWDLRKELGHSVADTLITRGMSLSASDPSMLDMRNAILLADQAGYGGAYADKVWEIFADRGMGFFAGSIDGGDIDVAESFELPPPPEAGTGVVTGQVTDRLSGEPAAGAVVKLAGLGAAYSATTDAEGRYELEAPPGFYPKVVTTGPGYLPALSNFRIKTGEEIVKDYKVDRDWAATSGGSSVASFDGPDYSGFGCGPAGAFDMSLGSGWGSTSGDDEGNPTDTFVPKSVVVELPEAVDVTEFLIDPSATCGDGADSSTGDYKIEVSADGSTWSVVNEGHFGTDAPGKLNSVAPEAAAEGVKLVRFTIEGNALTDVLAEQGQGDLTFAEACDPERWGGYFGGCVYTDLSEIAVLGTPAS
ncbi:M36 family metallopeptidase [Nocardioides sp.]|uniref:M36 family metallopeptidase n=1 Tax=Nocardioides sp. TaxID=35761 RepID=UPI003D6A3FF6